MIYKGSDIKSKTIVIRSKNMDKIEQGNTKQSQTIYAQNNMNIYNKTAQDT